MVLDPVMVAKSGDPLLRDGILPKAINHFRVGESVFLGTDLVNGDWLASLGKDIARLHAAGADVLVVSSGAIALGSAALGIDRLGLDRARGWIEKDRGDVEDQEDR